MVDDRAALALEGVSKTFSTRGGQIAALQKVDLVVAEGEFLTVVGPSGCGKSTILNLVAGLSAPSSGTISVNGRPVQGTSRSIGYISQRDNLLPWRTLIGNVEVGLELAGVGADERRRRARDVIARVGLTEFETRYPHELSGGMRQRVNIARTLVRDPEVVLMDEPFGSLDALTRGYLQQQLLTLWRESRKTIVFVTHDLVEAIALGDAVVVMSARPGRVKSIVPVPIARPRDVFQVHRLPGFEEAHAKVWAQLVGELAQFPLGPAESRIEAAETSGAATLEAGQ